uniref:Transmembrane protein n=1 Tax=viral metagenome TaxID=1070528 RepID=A0A6C0I2L3_9ZZZZ
MNKLVIVFFIMFVILEALIYYIYKNKQIIKESFVESYQGSSDVNYESCIKNGYPQTWCLSIQDPYGIVNPDSTLDKVQCNAKYK